MKNNKINDDKIKEDIISSSKAIRDKFKKLKLNKSKLEDDFIEKFKPIVDPLKQLVIKNNDASLNREEGKNKEKDETDEDKNVLSQLKELGMMVSKYIMLHLNNQNQNILDKIYGIHNELSLWKFGNSNISFFNDNIYIGEQVIQGTPGLFELLFLKKPNKDVYNTNDLKIYKSLILQTNAHKHGYDPSKQRNSNRGYKYRYIIKPLLDTATTGSGMSVHAARYEYWDDPNELVERLRLLLSSQSAGNNSHQNEILSIIEELREANIIE